jgi:hypothetical protein
MYSNSEYLSLCHSKAGKEGRVRFPDGSGVWMTLSWEMDVTIISIKAKTKLMVIF